MELYTTIKKLRTEKNWSQETLAEHAYVSRQTVSNWETGKSYPDVHSLLILSDLFGVSLDELMKGDIEIMKNTIQNEDARMLKKIEWMSLAEMLGLILGTTLLVEYGGEIGKLLGCLLAGILSVCIFLTFHRLEQIKQDHDIQTYREVLAFMKGETLDDIEKKRELEKRSSLKKLSLITAVCSIILLLFAAVFLILQLV